MMLKYISFLNPQKWTGQLILLFFFGLAVFFGGFIFGQNFQIKITPEQKPTTQINNEIKPNVKARSDGKIQFDLGVNSSVNVNDTCFTLSEAAKIIDQLPRRERKKLVRD